MINVTPPGDGHEYGPIHTRTKIEMAATLADSVFNDLNTRCIIIVCTLHPEGGMINEIVSPLPTKDTAKIFLRLGNNINAALEKNGGEFPPETKGGN